MMKKRTFLIELNTEELPAKNLFNLSKSFSQIVIEKLKFYQISYSKIEHFSTPRRLAIKVINIASEKIYNKEKRISKNVFKHGQIDQVIRGSHIYKKSLYLNSSKNSCVDKERFVIVKEKTVKIEEILLKLVLSSVKKLVFNSPAMRWNQRSIRFVRPVRNVVILLGNKVIAAKVFGVVSNRTTFGHFFMNNKNIKINDAKEYPEILERKGKVIADYTIRKNIILCQLKKKATELGGISLFDNALIEEVTSLVEWPEVLTASFPKCYLSIPSEIIIHTMQKNQKFFPIFNNKKKLINKFLLVSNIRSNNSENIVSGNEKVMISRLSDARFFFNLDRKKKLEDYLIDLKNVVFFNRLGSLYDRTKRMISLVQYLCKRNRCNSTLCIRASILSKCDLVTNVVKEFPDIQGIVGMTYALLDGEDRRVALAIKEQYKHIFLEEHVPFSNISCNLILADKFDTLVGMFIENSKISSKKDPFGIRRAAIGLILIIINKNISVDIYKLLKKSFFLYRANFDSLNNIRDKIIKFIFDRLFNLFITMKYKKSVIKSVIHLDCRNIVKISKKIKFLNLFSSSKNFFSLVTLYKRLNNIIKKNQLFLFQKVDFFLLKDAKEINLYQFFNKAKKKLFFLENKNKYKECFILLEKLNNIICVFFDKVLVHDKILKIKINRLTLISDIKSQLDNIVDFSCF